MTQREQTHVPYEIAAALHLRPDERPPFARWRYGLRAGFRSGIAYAVLQLGYFVISGGRWPATGHNPLLRLAVTDFVGIPVLLGVLALLLPFMRTMRSAVSLGAVIGALLGTGSLLVQEGSAALLQPVEGIMVGLGSAFCIFVVLLMREYAIVRWRPPRRFANHTA